MVNSKPVILLKMLQLKAMDFLVLKPVMANWKASSAAAGQLVRLSASTIMISMVLTVLKLMISGGAYASLNFGKWNALANYEKINNDVTNDPEVWIGKLTYGSAASDARGSWDAWVEYINSDKGALLGGATNSWRDDSVLDNVKSWGVGIDYTLAKNVILTAAQTFGTQTKHGNAADPDEFTDVEINFLF